MKLVEESLNEFERGVDPKRALGLGGYDFYTLYPGTILKCVRDFGVTHYKPSLHNPSNFKLENNPSSGGKITTTFSAKRGYKFFKDREHLLVKVETTLEPTVLKLKIICFFKEPQNENIRDARTTFINNKHLSTLGEKLSTIRDYREWFSSMITVFMTKKEFDNRFAIVEKGA